VKLSYKKLLVISLSILLGVFLFPINGEKNNNNPLRGTPINPQSSSTYYIGTSGTSRGIFVKDDYAYMSVFTSLAVINISDPTNLGNPVYSTYIGNADNVHVSGDYAYLTASNALAIIDISDPTNLGTPIYEDVYYSPKDVFISGNHAYLAAGAGLAIIDISNPTDPGVADYIQVTYGVALGVYVRGIMPISPIVIGDW